MNDYKSLIEELQSRYYPESLLITERRSFSDVGLYDTETLKYVKMAMAPVDKVFTAKSLEAGANAQKHLESGLAGIPVEFRFQGSVMTNTHIKGASDIDLIAFTGKFNSTEIFKIRKILNNIHDANLQGTDLLKLQDYSRNFAPYQGDYMKDLRELRSKCENILATRYNDCDKDKAKAIRVVNSHLKRDVDVVIATWFDNVDYVINGTETYRGVSVYNKDEDTVETPSCPFLAINKINCLDKLVGGRLKKMIRFLKNVCANPSDEIGLTSFEINAICYSMPIGSYKFDDNIELVHMLWTHMFELLQDKNQLLKIPSVDGVEYPFTKNTDKIAELSRLEDRVWGIYQDLINN